MTIAMNMKQRELFPYLIDQKIVGNYLVVLRELKLLGERKGKYVLKTISTNVEENFEEIHSLINLFDCISIKAFEYKVSFKFLKSIN